jgi:hypothetical protein
MIFRRRLLSSVVLVAVSLLAAAGRATARGAADVLRITAAANIALRQTPNSSAPVIAFLPLGTEITEAGPLGLDKTWLHVRLGDHREGWVMASLTRPLDPGRRWPTIERIVTDRLARHGDGFPSTVELADFIERVSPQIADASMAARFDLYRLQAIGSALAQIHFGHDKREPYLSWLDRYKGLVVYDEPGGRWILSNPAVWKIHDRHPDVPAADEIAWLAATTGLPGECEGELVCYFEATDRLSGQYLRAHPTGRHAGEAVKAIGDAAQQLSAPPADPHTLYVFDKARDCVALAKALDSLQAVVAATSAVGRDAALQGLGAMRKACLNR